MAALKICSLGLRMASVTTKQTRHNATMMEVIAAMSMPLRTRATTACA